MGPSVLRTTGQVCTLQQVSWWWRELVVTVAATRLSSARANAAYLEPGSHLKREGGYVCVYTIQSLLPLMLCGFSSGWNLPSFKQRTSSEARCILLNPSHIDHIPPLKDSSSLSSCNDSGATPVSVFSPLNWPKIPHKSLQVYIMKKRSVITWI